MISFFRKALSSWLALGLFGLILIAFLVTGFGSPYGMESVALTGDSVAKVGSHRVDAQEALASIQRDFDRTKAERPGMTMAQYLQSGGAEAQIDRLITDRALDAFAESEKLVISRRLIDRELAKVSAFHGPTGKFDTTRYDAVLRDNRLTDADVRGQYRREVLAKIVDIPSGAAARLPAQVGLAYARVQLETRNGLVATIPTARFAAAYNPADAEVSAFYAANAARYTVPETRVMRYALIAPDRFAGKVAASEAEVQAAYKANSAKFARSEKRTLTQVIAPDEAAAKALAAKGGALAGGTTLKPMDKASYAAIATAGAVADAAFAAEKGATVVAGKSALGWHVVKVDAIEVSGGKSLEQARAELLPELTKRKETEALLDFITTLEEAVDDGQTLEAIAKTHSLTLIDTPALTAAGVAPDAREFKLDAPLLPLVKEAFSSEVDDDPMVGTLDAQTGLSALYDVVKINAAAPRPLAAIKDQVRQDAINDRAAKDAKKAANAVLAKVNKGMALNAALASENLGAAAPLSGKRTDLSKGPAALPAGFGTLFDLSRGKARLDELADKKGYSIVWLASITPGDPKSDANLVGMLNQQLSQQAGGEYTQQFLNAMMARAGVERNAESIARLKRSLTNPSGQ